eukprot:6629878-Prymnesium_polylepis.1
MIVDEHRSSDSSGSRVARRHVSTQSAHDTRARSASSLPGSWVDCRRGPAVGTGRSDLYPFVAKVVRSQVRRGCSRRTS